MSTGIPSDPTRATGEHGEARPALRAPHDLCEADAARVREALEAGAATLDDATRQRLAVARRAAVAAATRAPRWRALAWPAAALAASLALWVGLREPAPALPPPVTDVAAYAQGLAVATGDEAAALDEDLEFYAWLEAQSQGG